MKKTLNFWWVFAWCQSCIPVNIKHMSKCIGVGNCGMESERQSIDIKTDGWGEESATGNGNS